MSDRKLYLRNRFTIRWKDENVRYALACRWPLGAVARLSRRAYVSWEVFSADPSPP